MQLSYEGQLTCEFGAFLDDALRDKFVCGLIDNTVRPYCIIYGGLQKENIQRRLLAEADLELKKALELGRGKKIHCFSGKTFPTLEAGGRFFY